MKYQTGDLVIWQEDNDILYRVLEVFDSESGIFLLKCEREGIPAVIERLLPYEVEEYTG